MTDLSITVKGGDGVLRDFRGRDNGDGTITLYHAEDATQRTALLSALNTNHTAQLAVQNNILKALGTQASGVTALAGSFTGTSQQYSSVYVPVLGRPLVLTVSGTWVGTIQLLRSTDGGTTKIPITVGGEAWGIFTTNCNEPVWSETVAEAVFYLSATLTSGTLNYRLTQ